MKNNYLKTKQLALILVLLCFTIILNAQFTEQTGINNPFNGLNQTSGRSAPVLIDFDNDGDLDLVSGNFDGTIQYYQNDGTDTFIEQTGTNNPFSGIDFGSYSAPFIIDLDNDGDLDLISGNFDGIFQYYSNDGTSVFIEQTGVNNPFDGLDAGLFSIPIFEDLDNDGDLDLISGNSSGTFPLYLNNGSNVFTVQPGASSPFFGLDAGEHSTPILIDLDNDGDLDLASGNSSGTFPLYLNNGTNVFTVQPGASSPLFGLDTGSYSKPIFADLDNDNDWDLISGNNFGTFNYYDNDGTLSITTTNIEFPELNIYPNPATTTLRIESYTALKYLDIYTLQGRHMMHSDVPEVNISELGEGIYLIKLEDINGSISTKQFIKQ